MSRWGGRTKPHPITGEAVPDETDQVLIQRPVNSKATAWPAAEFIVGNPPFVAAQYMREKLGDGYAEALWAAYPKVPRASDLAMFFWWKAARLVAAGKARRFGLITSNSLDQAFARKVVTEALEGRNPLHLVFAIPDHPWAQGVGTAAVRIAMTVTERRRGIGRLLTVEGDTQPNVPITELKLREGIINPDLTIGASPASAKALLANKGISSRGMTLHGAGFIVSPTTAIGLGLGKIPGLDRHIRPYLSGRDLVQRTRGAMLIDLYGLTEEEVRQRFPAVFQHLLLREKPERDQNNRKSYRDNWWVFGEPRSELRPALKGLPRYIVTLFAAKHRPFVFQPAYVLPDNMLICIASEEAWHLGVLSSRFHVEWALKAGGTLEDRPLYNKTSCFDPFPFPAATAAQSAAIGAIAEELDAHRKARMAAHAHLTLTMFYNALERERSGAVLTEAERDVHDAGQISILRHLHDRLDEAVASAYGWPADLPAIEIVARIVALNAQRRAEEADGLVRWLRPDFQAPEETRRAATQPALGIEEPEAPDAISWPRDDAARQFIVLRTALARSTAPAAPSELARRVKGAPRGAKIGEMLRVLVALGQAREAGSGRYTA